MKNILKASAAHPIRKGEFNIDIHFPGMAVEDRTDKRGLAQLGRFDRGRLKPGVFVAMHPHVNDEILSYIRKGSLVHEDTEGDKTIISNTKLMMMNAGSGIHHQESIPEDGEDVEMLQIFIRPSSAGLKPQVQFHDFKEAFNYGTWRKIAGPSDQEVPLKINSEATVYDTRLEEDSLKALNLSGKTYVLYVFDGGVETDGISLQTGDLLVYENEDILIVPQGTVDLVLFELDLNASYTREGMYSGV